MENNLDPKIDVGDSVDALKVDESMKLLFTADKEALILFVNNAFQRHHNTTKLN